MISRTMVVVTVVMAVLLAAADLWLWFDRSIIIDAIHRQSLPSDAGIAASPGIVFMVLVLAQMSFALGFWTLWNIFALFRAYRDGAVFTPEAGRRLRFVGIAFCAYPFVQALVTALGSVLLTLGNPPGARHLAISFEAAHLIIGIAGALLIVVGWVLVEAARIADDNRQIV